MSQMTETDDPTVLFDPEYQNGLYMIENAMRETGLLKPEPDALPTVFDEKLRVLIDSVSLE